MAHRRSRSCGRRRVTVLATLTGTVQAGSVAEPMLADTGVESGMGRFQPGPDGHGEANSRPAMEPSPTSTPNSSWPRR